jgi:hypothetical protein
MVVWKASAELDLFGRGTCNLVAVAVVVVVDARVLVAGCCCCCAEQLLLLISLPPPFHHRPSKLSTFSLAPCTLM